VKILACSDRAVAMDKRKFLSCHTQKILFGCISESEPRMVVILLA